MITTGQPTDRPKTRLYSVAKDRSLREMNTKIYGGSDATMKPEAPIPVDAAKKPDAPNLMAMEVMQTRSQNR